MIDEINKLFSQNDNQKALLLLREYIEKNPTDAEQCYRLAVIEEQIGEPDLTLKAYDKALKAAPNNPIVFLYAGCFFLKNKQEEKGLSILSLGQDIDGRITQIHANEKAAVETRQRSYQADMALRNHFTHLHNGILDQNKPLPNIASSVWPQTHNQAMAYSLEAQRPHLFYAPGLKAEPIWDKQAFDWFELITEKFSQLKKEFLMIKDVYDKKHSPYLDESYKIDGFEQLVGKDNWSALHLFKNGVPDDEVLAALPETAKVLAKLPLYNLNDYPFEVFYSVLKGNQHIKPHFGLSNHSLTVHLPLIVPGDGYLRVADKTHIWTEGAPVVFDDSFDHEAKNGSNTDRVVLIFSVWHPDLSENEQEAIRKSFSLRQQWHDNRKSYIPLD
jgi:aspartyl/asparaginyl beta-hydroxylase (cupin superfamily)